MAKLVPLLSSALGHHKALSKGAGGVWFPPKHLHHRQGYHHRPVIWTYQWPKALQDQLITELNLNGTITNSDLELVGGLLHLQAICQEFDGQESTILSKTDNLATLFWQHKGSATTKICPHFLLRLFGIHQQHHRYVPRYDYLSCTSNPIANILSHLFSLTNTQLVQFISSYHKQSKPFQLVTIEPKVISAVICALQTKLSKPEPLLVNCSHLGAMGVLLS